MDKDDLLRAVVPLITDLSRERPGTDRYKSLFASINALIPTDLAALRRLDGDALTALQAFARLASATVGTANQTADAAEFSAARADMPAEKISLRQALDAYERAAISASLAKHGGKWASAARDLGMDRANLARRAKGLGLTPLQKTDEGKSVAEIVKLR